jgi:phospholipid transport system substrate-binding protein
LTIRHATVLALVALVLVLGVPAWAGEPTEQAREYTDQVLKVLEDKHLKPQDRRAAVRKVANEVFDVSETAKRALGRHWQARTQAEREEFTAIFADLLEGTYIAKIDRYGGEQIRYTGEVIDGDFATVKARILRKGGVEVPVEARMLKRGGRWLIYDLLIENISLVNSYRSQFDQIIRSSSFAELVRRLKEKREELLNDGRVGSSS